MPIAISAFACSANRGSEHELGWKCLKQCSRCSSEVHLFTSAKINPHVKEQVSEHHMDNVIVHYVDFPTFVDTILKSLPGAGYQVVAYAWEFKLFFHMLRRYRRDYFNLAVKSTFGSYRWPSFLWCFSKELHVDPLSGGGRCPLRFYCFFSHRARLHELIRVLFQRVSLYDPFVLLTLFKAKKIFPGNAATYAILPEFARNKCIVKKDFLSADASDFKIDEARACTSISSNNLKIFYTGKLLEWKGVRIVLEALSRLPDDVKYQFTVMGDGPARKSYDDYINKKKLNVVFIDPKKVPRSDLSFYFFAHHIFAFPTLHGEGGLAPVEAKLHGMRLLTLDFSGLHSYMTLGDICIQTEGHTADEVVQSIADAIEAEYRKLKDPSLYG